MIKKLAMPANAVSASAEALQEKRIVTRNISLGLYSTVEIPNLAGEEFGKNVIIQSIQVKDRTVDVTKLRCSLNGVTTWLEVSRLLAATKALNVADLAEALRDDKFALQRAVLNSDSVYSALMCLSGKTIAANTKFEALILPYGKDVPLKRDITLFEEV